MRRISTKGKFLHLNMHAKMVLTDSGGLQEETTVLGGYTPEVDIPHRQLPAYASVEDNLTFVTGRRVPIEIHWELSGRYLAKPIGLEYVSRRLSSIAMQARTFPIFSPEHHLIYLCLHGTKHCWEQLDLVACLADLLLKETNEAGQDPRFSLFRLQVRDSRFDAARYLLRMVFCPSKSEWKAMRLPSSFTFGYWVVRPFRILWSGVAGTIAGKWRDLN